MAATWDPDLVERVARATAVEVASTGGKTLKLFREARVIEHVPTRAEYLVERFQMQRIGIGQRAVNVEQQRLP